MISMSHNTSGDFSICQCTCKHQKFSGNSGKVEDGKKFYLQSREKKWPLQIESPLRGKIHPVVCSTLVQNVK